MTSLTVPVILPPNEAPDAAKALADEAAQALRIRGAKTEVLHEEPKPGTVDGFLLIGPQRLPEDALKEGDDLTQRATALATLADAGTEPQVRMHRARQALRKRGAFVLARQLTVEPEVFGVYGLEDENIRERLEALIELLLHEAERLQLDREGWEPAPS